MKFKFYGGVGEIGGNKILVEHKNTRIFLDFGMSFSQMGKFYSEFLQPRKCAGLKDFFEFKLLPDIKGVYRQDYLEHMGRKKEPRSIDAVLLSHAHADHAQFIHFLRKDIPIYCTKESKIILQALEETGSSSINELVSCCDAFTFYETKKGTIGRVTRKTPGAVKFRNYKLMTAGKSVKIGDLSVRMFPVDHSVPGACGFIIKSDEGTLVYTGDLRFHGRKYKNSLKFVEEAAKAKPKWLICEGTRIDTTKSDSEEEVFDKIKKYVKETEGLVFVEHPIRDLDRVKTIYEAAKASGRVFVIDFKLAYLAELLGDLCPFKLDDVKILVPRKSWGLICKDVDEYQKAMDYATWERTFTNRKNSITYKDLIKNPSGYVVSMNLWGIGQLVDIKPKSAIWIRSFCEPFSVEMELDEVRRQNWLKHFGIREVSAHASGHANGAEIRAMIKRINPQILIPIHTEHANLFKGRLESLLRLGCEVKIPRLEDG